MKINLNTTIKTFLVKIFALSMIFAMSNSVSLAQTRIRFGRGRSSATVSGSLSADGSRMYVLRAGAGQTLYARVSSGNGQVTITGANGNGSDDYEITTDDGDNSIGIYNPGGATRFTLTVSIR